MSFTRVSKKQPCPICQRPDWCRVFADGWAECMRVESDRPAKSGGWMHRLGGGERWRGDGGWWIGDGRQRTDAGGRKSEINAAKLMREWSAATAAKALAEFAAALGVSVSSLAAVGAAWAAPYAAWAFPMCDGYGNVVGIRLRNERGKFAVRGSRQGIFLGTWKNGEEEAGSREENGCPLTMNQEKVEVTRLNSSQESNLLLTNRARSPQASPPMGERVLYVCEGPTDTAAAIELGLCAVGRPNCCCGGPEIRVFVRRGGYRRVVVVADNDKPGLEGARKVGAELGMPFVVYVPPAKDVREFVRLGGTRGMVENAIKSTVWRHPETGERLKG